MCSLCQFPLGDAADVVLSLIRSPAYWQRIAVIRIMTVTVTLYAPPIRFTLLFAGR